MLSLEVYEIDFPGTGNFQCGMSFGLAVAQFFEHQQDGREPMLFMRTFYNERVRIA